MLKLVLTVVLGAIGCGVWRRFVSPQPQFPPLVVSDDDAELLEAVARARSSVDDFRELLQGNGTVPQVKLPVVTSSGETEYLWAEVLKLTGDTLKVRLVTPPVTHDGELNRVRMIELGAIADWQIKKPNGRFVGGFTQRVMFARARDQWGELPDALRDLKQQYDEIKH